jgi:hypothetical protein
VQDSAKGKLRTRLFRFIKFNFFTKKTIARGEIHGLYEIKEIDGNIIHYKNPIDNGYAAIYRISGFDPSVLSQAARENCIEAMIDTFAVKMRFKIVSCSIAYQIPNKDFANKSTHPGINYAKNKYIERLDNLNDETRNEEKAYFLILEGPKEEIIDANYQILKGKFSQAMMSIYRASTNEMQQVLNEF